MKKDIIVIAGGEGSGKSSTAKLVAERLGWEHFSSGDLMREVAFERGISLIELQRLAEDDPTIDQDIDRKNQEIGKKDKFVIDSRLAFHFIPDSFKVFLSLPFEVSVDRIWYDLQHNPHRTGENSKTKEDLARELKERRESNRRRYEDFYQIDYLDESQFDLVIDTEKNNLHQAAEIVISEFNNWKN